MAAPRKEDRKFPRRKLVRISLLGMLSASLLVPGLGLSAAQSANADGERLYSDYCSSCHGEELRNTSGGVTYDLRRLKPGDHERFVSVVLNGKNQMPPWRGALEPDQIEAICRYMRVTLDK